MTEWEHFSTVCEWNRTFSRRVECREEEDEECHQAKMGIALLGNVEAEASSEQAPCHFCKIELAGIHTSSIARILLTWEGEEQQSAATKGIDCEHCRKCEDEVHETEAKGDQESSEVRGTGLSEHAAGVEGDDVDAALQRRLVTGLGLTF